MTLSEQYPARVKTATRWNGKIHAIMREWPRTAVCGLRNVVGISKPDTAEITCENCKKIMGEVKQE